MSSGTLPRPSPRITPTWHLSSTTRAPASSDRPRRDDAAGGSARTGGSGQRARLLETIEIRPGRQRLSCHAPSLAARAQPGQYVYLTDPAPRGLLLPALPIAGYRRTSGSIELDIDSSVPRTAAELLSGVRVGDEIGLAGPFGRGFELDSRSRYLLVVADSGGLSRVRSIVGEAVTSGRQVTILLEARSVDEVFPSSLLPDEVEYVVATADGSLGHHGSVIDLVPDFEAWADQCFAAGDATLLDRIEALARGRDARMGVARLGRRRSRRGALSSSDARRKAWLQVALPHPAGCALGVCLGCITPGAKGPLRVCREGPAFAADELRWESAT